jgi:mannose-1-phosphate guanylyltransferase
MAKPLNVMLLAAGEGIRLRPYTEKTPKPAIPFLTCPLAGYSLALLAGVEIGNLVVNTYHLPNQIHTLMPNLIARRKPEKAGPKESLKELQFSDESKGLLGSGGGIQKAKPHLTGSGIFMVLNADEVILPEDPDTITDFIEGFRASNEIARLLVMEHPEVGEKFGGVWCKREGRVQVGQSTNRSRTVSHHGVKIVSQFAKKSPGAEFDGYHFIGPMLFRESIFKYFKPPDPQNGIVTENILYDTLSAAMAKGENVGAVPVQCSWFETGNPQDFLTGTKEALEILANNTGGKGNFLRKTIGLFGGQIPQIEANESEIIANYRKLGIF